MTYSNANNTIKGFSSHKSHENGVLHIFLALFVNNCIFAYATLKFDFFDLEDDRQTDLIGQYSQREHQISFTKDLRDYKKNKLYIYIFRLVRDPLCCPTNCLTPTALK